jgi:hypothetical protein
MKRGMWTTVVVAWVVGLAATLALWAFGDYSNLYSWIGRLALPLILIDSGGLLYRRRPRRPVTAPDPLRDLVGGYYERDGMCVAPQFKISNGLCWLHLYVQNRYARGGSVRIAMTPEARNNREAEVLEEIECKGGAMVVRRIPYPTPSGLSGRSVSYRLAASAHYPKERGRLIHYAGGTRVVMREETRLLPYGCSAALLLAFVRRYQWERIAPTVAILPLPGGAEHIPDDLPGEQELLWEPPSGPTGGFFVLPAASESLAHPTAQPRNGNDNSPTAQAVDGR